LGQGETAKQKKPIPKALTNQKNTEARDDEKLFYMGKGISFRAWASVEQKACWCPYCYCSLLDFVF
jgi:hypothetical protein